MINGEKQRIKTIRSFFKLLITVDKTFMIKIQNDYQLSFWLEDLDLVQNLKILIFQQFHMNCLKLKNVDQKEKS